MEKSIKELNRELEIQKTEIEKVKEQIERVEYKALLKVRKVQNISGIMCLLCIVGLFSSVFIFIWWTLILSLKVFYSSVVIYCFFWVINKSAGIIVKQLENKIL
jgi:hypothetical protein